ncbi:MAG: FtsX-like permease family protein [Bacteroidales bacterium]
MTRPQQPAPRPPAWALRFLAWYCKPGLAEDLTGDLFEYFERNLRRVGPRRARWIFILDTLKFFRPYTVRSPQFLPLFFHWFMIGSYLKTSTRNAFRNKLFSSINVFGLAVAMSVGLLLISFVLDLRSYDRFNERGDRIFRVSSVLTTERVQNSKFASASVRTGRLIREKVSGIEEVAVVRDGFARDATIGDHHLPVQGYWAEPSLLRILTLPMVEGDPETALEEPYAIVLTESAATKLFGREPALGQTLQFDSIAYEVTGILGDLPFFSHLKFEALVSFATAEREHRFDPEFEAWTDMWSNYVYVMPEKRADPASIRSQLEAIARDENQMQQLASIRLELLPLYKIVVGESLQRSEGLHTVQPHMSPFVLWMLGGLAFVVILSACFNYTNLSIARAMRRFKEIGLRKTMGAGRRQVREQLLAESILISLASLLLSYALFLVLRPQLIQLAPELQHTVRLELTPAMVLAFVLFSIAVGGIAGFLPALFFSKVPAIQALRNVASVKVFKHLSLRRALVVLQYTITLILITATSVGYVQYKHILHFDLGFRTDNILNINLQGNNPEPFLAELEKMPEIRALSRSLIITSVGNYWGGFLKYKDTRDSALIGTNLVDENYLPLHEYEFLAGGNFVGRPATPEAAREVIVSLQVLKRFQIGETDPRKAIGEEVILNGRKLTIAGVVPDIHYGTIQDRVAPVAFLQWTPGNRTMINAKIQGADLQATRTKIQAAWEKFDPDHPFQAEFYTDAIENAYSELSSLIKIIGFLSILAISIASLGMFGMLVFSTETRRKEIGIRKVMGAGPANLIYVLSRDFLSMLTLSALIALPVTYLFFQKMVLTRFPYHTPVGLSEMGAGLLGVLVIAFGMMASQTWKTAMSDPAGVLKTE